MRANIFLIPRQWCSLVKNSKIQHPVQTARISMRSCLAWSLASGDLTHAWATWRDLPRWFFPLLWKAAFQVWEQSNSLWDWHKEAEAPDWKGGRGRPDPCCTPTAERDYIGLIGLEAKARVLGPGAGEEGFYYLADGKAQAPLGWNKPPENKANSKPTGWNLSRMDH